MAAEDKPAPNADEVRQQLSLMLASGEFRTRVRPSQLLTLLVEEAIEGRTLDEDEIRKKLYTGSYDPKGTNVRTAVSLLRDLITQYYKNEGHNDLITISLPKKFSKQAPRKGRPKPYPVVFAYNPLTTDTHLFTLARAAQKRGTPAAVRKALETFESILRTHPDHFEASLARLECLCLMAIYIPDQRPRKQIIEDAVTLGTKMTNEHPDDWRVLALFGVALACCHQLPLAASVYRKAIKMNLDEVIQSLWTPIMCLVTGDLAKACEIARHVASDRLNDSTAWSIYGICLYFARDFKEAQRILWMAVNLEPQMWLPYLILVFVYLALRKPKIALEAYSLADRRMAEGEVFMPVLPFLAASRIGVDKVAVESRYIQATKRLLEPPNELKDCVQIALATLQLGAPSVKALTAAWRFYHPLVLLIPWWPVFDPLRKRKDFKELVKQIYPFPAE